MCDIVRCAECEMAMDRKGMVSHLEDFHVGKSQLSDLLLRCPDCPFHITLAQVDVMINHCSGTNHNFEKIRYLWSEFAQKETERISKLIRLGVGMQKNGRFGRPLTNSAPLAQGTSRVDADAVVAAGISAAIEAEEENEESDDEGEDFSSKFIKEEILSDEEPSHSPKTIPFHFPAGSQPGSSSMRKEIKEEAKDETPMFRQLFSAPSTSQFIPSRSMIKTEHETKTAKATRGRSSGLHSVLHRGPTIATKVVEPRIIGSSHQREECSKLPETPNGRATMSCTLCCREFARQGGNQAIFIHAMRKHDSTLFPLACTVCGYGAEGPSAMTAHTKRGKYAEMGCDGSYVPIKVPNLVSRLRHLVAKLFPNENWLQRIPPGSIIYGHAEDEEGEDDMEIGDVVGKGERKRTITTSYPKGRKYSRLSTTPSHKSSVTSQMSLMHPEPTKSFESDSSIKCAICLKTLPVLGSVEISAVKHAVREHDRSLLPLACATCGQGAETLHQIKLHASTEDNLCDGSHYSVEEEPTYLPRLKTLIHKLFPSITSEIIEKLLVGKS